MKINGFHFAAAVAAAVGDMSPRKSHFLSLLQKNPSRYIDPNQILRQKFLYIDKIASIRWM